MKFAILKLILALTTISVCSHLVSSLQTKTGMATNLNLGLKSGMNMNMNSNYKMSLRGVLSKNHKKSETNYSTKSNNKNTELNRMNSKIIFKGWLKYFKFPDDETQNKPKEFFKNALYERDSKRIHPAGEVIFIIF